MGSTGKKHKSEKKKKRSKSPERREKHRTHKRHHRDRKRKTEYIETEDLVSSSSNSEGKYKRTSFIGKIICFKAM